jgi:hypothetical protein
MALSKLVGRMAVRRTRHATATPRRLQDRHTPGPTPQAPRGSARPLSSLSGRCAPGGSALGRDHCKETIYGYPKPVFQRSPRDLGFVAKSIK